MKKLLFLLLVLVGAQVKAQAIKGSIDLKDSTINRTVPFEVAEGARSVKYALKVYVSRGAVTVTITDPHEKKATGFTAGSQQPGGGHEASKVESSDSVSPPVAGIWKLNIRTENATGRISYQIDVIKP